MIADIEGVRIDSIQFPGTYQARNRIRRIAINFKQPVQDMLQESMMKELELTQHPTKNLTDKSQYIQNYLCRSLHTRGLNYQSRHTFRHTNMDHVQDYVEGTFVVFSRKQVYTKMFIDELFQILKAKDRLLHTILRYKAKNASESWRSIYRKHYASQMWKTVFFRKVDQIRVEAKKLAKHNKNLLDGTLAGSSRLNKYGILCDTGSSFGARVHKLHRDA